MDDEGKKLTTSMEDKNTSIEQENVDPTDEVHDDKELDQTCNTNPNTYDSVKEEDKANSPTSMKADQVSLFFTFKINFYLFEALRTVILIKPS